MKWLDGKAIVIIGGTSGIGLSAAQAFIKEGATVVALGKDEESVSNASKTLSTDAILMAGDATQEGIAESAIETCLNKFNRFDGMYHVAGGSGRKFGDGPLHEMTLHAWQVTMQINLTSVMLSNRAAIKSFINRKVSGTILNLASVLAFAPAPKYFATHAYSTSKAAIIGLTKSTASYYSQDNIRINALAPSLFETPMSARVMNDPSIISYINTKQPLDGGRVGMPVDLDGAAIYMMSDHAKFTTGQVLAVDGGWSLSEGQFQN